MLLRLDGETLVRRAARRALAAGLEPVIAVLGHDAESVRAELADLPIDVVINPAFAGPTSTSLHAGLRHIQAEAAATVVLLADMVRVTEGMLRQIADALIRGDALVVAARYDGVVAPPFGFHRSVFSDLLSATGDGVGKSLATRHGSRTIFLDWQRETLADVDTPEDYDRLTLA